MGFDEDVAAFAEGGGLGWGAEGGVRGGGEACGGEVLGGDWVHG